jgi:cell wall-associated NlpC family hydrolase
VTSRGEVFLAEVREWIGTPFHDQASAKGKGCDCKGLLWGAARECRFPEADSFYATFIGYDLSRGVPHDLLKEGMAALFDRVNEMRPGDILLCHLKKRARRPGHLAVYSGGEKAIHTQINSKSWVKENSLRSLFFYYPLDSIWRWRA